MEEIRKLYLKAGIPEFLIDNEVDKFVRNPDILEEFVEWIKNKKYRDNGVNICGYNAKTLAGLSEFLDGEGAFSMLVLLRENEEEAKKRINQGFYIR